MSKSITPYYQDESVTIYHGDCREILPTLPKVDLVLTDPPYGTKAHFGSDSYSRTHQRRAGSNMESYEWDNEPVDLDLLSGCLSLGSRACCWGGNYYSMPPSPAWLVWDKVNTGKFSDCELAWTNYGCAARVKRHMWNGMIRKGREQRNGHPTQKPLAVIKWCIELCPGCPQTILDPFMGSGTTLRAAKDLGRKAIGIEIEERYCEIAAERMRQEVLPLEVA